MQTLCKTPLTFMHVSDWVFGFFEVGIILIIISVFCIAIKKIAETSINLYKKILQFVFITGSLFVGFLSLSIVNLITYIFLFPTNNPLSADYHVLNAAIKNTCFLDPNKLHCPKTVEDLINIEPNNFKKLTRNAHLVYQYYPDSNQYTLIIRNKNIWRNGYRVVIFDPRLITAKNYGNGMDFIDTEILNCNGKYILNNPPPFNGPWDQIN